MSNQAQSAIDSTAPTADFDASDMRSYMKSRGGGGGGGDEYSLATNAPDAVSQETTEPPVEAAGQDDNDTKQESAGKVPQDSESDAGEKTEAKTMRVEEVNRMVKERLSRQQKRIDKRYTDELERLKGEVRRLSDGETSVSKPAGDEKPKADDKRFANTAEWFDALAEWEAKMAKDEPDEPDIPEKTPGVAPKGDADEIPVENDSPNANMTPEVQQMIDRAADAALSSDEVPESTWDELCDLDREGEIVLTREILVHMSDESVDADERAKFMLAMVNYPEKATRAARLSAVGATVKAIQKLVPKPEPERALGNADKSPNQKPLRRGSNPAPTSPDETNEMREYMALRGNSGVTDDPYRLDYAPRH